jgi:hypothetical protein
MEPTALTKKSRAILEAIADGHTHDQILANFPAWTCQDIARTAAETLAVANAAPPGKTYKQRMDEIRQAHPRAYEKWTDEEDYQLGQLFRAEKSVKEIARLLQRQPSAIRSRLEKLNPTPPSRRAQPPPLPPFPPVQPD